jgi:penicillin amidase
VLDFLGLLGQLDLSEGFAAEDWRSRIGRWNAEPFVGSEEAVVFELWLEELSKLPMLTLMPENSDVPASLRFWHYPTFILSLYSNNSTEPCFSSMLPDLNSSSLSQSCRDYARDAFLKVVQDVGGNKLKWGRQVHQAQFSHSLFGPSNSLHCISCSHTAHGGDFATVDSGMYSPLSKANQQDFGQSFRMIVDLGDLESSMFISTPGQSGNLWSSDYSNWMDLWAKGKYIQMTTQVLSILDQHPHQLTRRYALEPM